MKLDYYVRKEGDEPKAIAYVERALIGALIIDCGLRGYAVGVKPEDFSNAFRAAVFRAVMDIEGPVDLVILGEYAERNGISSPNGVCVTEYLASFVDLVPSVENVAEYARIVRQASIARKLESRRRGGSPL